MNKSIYIFTLLFLLIFSGCSGGGGSSSTDNSELTNNNSSSVLDGNEQTINDKPNNAIQATTLESSENEYDKAITLAAAKIDNMTVQVNENGMKSTSDMLDSLNSELHSFVDMTESATQTMISAMNYANALSQPFSFADEYKNYFDIDMDYSSVKSAFILKKVESTKKYLLLSSDSSLFLQGHTLKSYFFDMSSLTVAWTKAISLANKDKNLYFTIHEIDKDGTLHSVCNSFSIENKILKDL